MPILFVNCLWLKVNYLWKKRSIICKRKTRTLINTPLQPISQNPYSMQKQLTSRKQTQHRVRIQRKKLLFDFFTRDQMLVTKIKKTIDTKNNKAQVRKFRWKERSNNTNFDTFTITSAFDYIWQHLIRFSTIKTKINEKK